MKTKFNFNSQICTTREQSERLLALSLKKETADMCWTKMAAIRGTFYVPELAPTNMVSWRHTPAWSLHRLIELKQPNTIDNALIILSREQTYDKLIGMIVKSIEGGNFPKEYLEEQL